MINEYNDLNELFSRMKELYLDKHSIQRFRTEQKLLFFQQKEFKEKYNEYIKNKDFSNFNNHIRDKFLERINMFNNQIDIRIK